MVRNILKGYLGYHYVTRVNDLRSSVSENTFILFVEQAAHIDINVYMKIPNSFHVVENAGIHRTRSDAMLIETPARCILNDCLFHIPLFLMS